MSKIALVFPGQGSQYSGMGKDLYEKYDICREVFDSADSILGMPLKDFCFSGSQEDLKKTQITQPAIVTVSYACFKLFKTLNIPYEVIAGHSVGEYAALAASGALSFSDALKLVRARGELMAASSDKKAAMAAVIGLDANQLDLICREASYLGAVVVANINSPEQIVISGEELAVDEAMNLSLASGAKRAVKLEVSGAFHSPLMANAKEKLGESINKYDFKNMTVPMVSNVTAEYITDGAKIKQLMFEQITSKVLWVDIINNMLSNGIDTFIELGPGKVLSALIKRISRDVKIFNISDGASAETVGEDLCVRPS